MPIIDVTSIGSSFSERRDRILTTTVLVGVTLVLMNIASIFAIYPALVFHRWPWFRSSFWVSAITCLSPYVAHYYRRHARCSIKTLGVMAFEYGALVVPVCLFLLYPGTTELGLYTDEKVGILLVLWGVLHAIGFSRIIREIDLVENQQAHEDALELLRNQNDHMR